MTIFTICEYVEYMCIYIHYVYEYRVGGTIGCLQLQVSFRKRVTNYRALLHTLTYNEKADMSVASGNI